MFCLESMIRLQFGEHLEWNNLAAWLKTAPVPSRWLATFSRGVAPTVDGLVFSRPHETGFGMIWGNYWITILKMAKKIRSVTFDHLSRLLDFKPLFQWPIGCNFQWLCGTRLWQLAEEPSGCPAQALQARSFCHWLPQVLRLAPMLCIGAAEWSWRCSHEIQLGEWMVSFLRKDGVLDQIQGGWNSSGDVFCSFPEMDNLPAWEFVFGQSTRWYCYIGNYWKSPIEILDFPIKNCDFP